MRITELLKSSSIALNTAPRDKEDAIRKLADLMEHTIADLQQSIETPADKIRRLQEQMAEFQQRADSFPAESIDHKIISQAIEGLRQRIEKMQSSDAVAEEEQIYRDQVNNGTDGFALFVEE